MSRKDQMKNLDPRLRGGPDPRLDPRLRQGPPPQHHHQQVGCPKSFVKVVKIDFGNFETKIVFGIETSKK